jgi:polysaccharide export outer membrane protein
MSLKTVFALVYAAALCCAQTDGTSSSGVPSSGVPSSGVPAREAPLPASTIPAPPNAGETNQNAAPPAAQAEPSVQAATVGDQPAASGKVAAEGRLAGAKPDNGRKGYVIGPLDVLQIKVWNNANLSGIVAVDSDGTISMPLIGEIKADGLTPRQLKEKISERLKDFFNNDPNVDVSVAKVNSKRFFVYGGVGHAGEFPLIEETTVMDALANTGGFKEFANKKKIYIMRDTQRFNFNYKEVSEGKNMKQNIVLENGDRIYVPE